MKIELPELRDGEHNAGLMLDENGRPEYWLIEAPMPKKSMNFGEFKAWSKKQDYRSASTREGWMLAVNRRKGLPKNSEFWLGDTGGSGIFGFTQRFDSPSQYCTHKTKSNRARAVRRVPVKECE